MKTAFVLSGGSIKGAFQAGALEVVLARGKVPMFASSISVGSLNSIWLANEAGRAQLEQGKVDWPALGKKLTAFWTDQVRQPSDLVDIKSWLHVGWDILWKQFEGLVSTDPLRKLVKDTISPKWIKASPFGLQIGAVDYYTGEIKYYDKDDADIVDHVMGSAAIPFAMPASVTKAGKVLFDGGVRDVAPLKPAMKSGADEVIVIACQARNVLDDSDQKAAVNHRDFLKLAERITDIMTNEIVNADIDYAEEINEIVRLGRERDFAFTKGKTERKIVVIRPLPDFVADITKFTSSDIQQMMNLGRKAAQAALDSGAAAA